VAALPQREWQGAPLGQGGAHAREHVRTRSCS
jgi:hypothetical protein